MKHRKPSVHRNLFTLLPVFVLLLGLMPAGPASATTGVMAIDSDTTLTDNHYGSIVITADSVTLDCDGLTIASDNPPVEGAGILLEDVTGVTVKNCHVSGFEFGVRLSGVSHGTIKDTSASGNWDNGFLITEGSHDNTLRGNHAEDNESHGFEIRFSHNNTLAKNTSTSNGGGFQVSDESTANVLIGNEAWDNGMGFSLGTYATGNTLVKNYTHHNDNGFIAYEYSTDNTLAHNRVVANEIGFSAMDNSPDNRLVHNTFCDSELFHWDYWEDSEPIMVKNEECDPEASD